MPANTSWMLLSGGIMKNKILSILLYIFTFLFLIYPTSYGISDLKVVFTFAVILILVIFLYKKVKIFQKIHINEKFYPWIILVLAIATRIGIVLLFESHIIQVSDFGGAFSASNTLDFSSDYHRVFTHWILYPTLIHGIYQIFGSSQLVALLTNAVILIVASILVYKVSSLLFKNKTAGFVSALLYIFWPSNILYTLIFTQEHICLLLLLIVLYLFLIIENKEDLKLSIKNVILLLLIGICLGLSTFFKNFAPAFIIAFIIYYFLKGFTEKNIKKYTLMKLGTIVIILIGFITTKNLVFIGIDHLAGHPVARNITPCYLNVGLNTNGTYNAGIYNEYFNAVKEKIAAKETVTFKNKKINLQSLKNLSLQDIRNFDYRSFYTRYKQQILTAFVAVMGIFFLFYWTDAFLSSQINNAKTRADNTYSKLEKVANMAGQIQFAKKSGINAMTKTLLVYIQDTGAALGISDKIVNLRPVSASKGIEHVTLRLENLYYDEFIKFIADIEKYDNLSIKVINFNKRYDNPKMIDSSIEIVKV